MKRYFLKDQRLVFITPREQAEMDQAYAEWLASEGGHTCWVFACGRE